MKIESCTRTYETICDNPKFCCDSMKDAVDNRLMSLDIGRILLFDRGPNNNLFLIPIHYCPFCGEKIE